MTDRVFVISCAVLVGMLVVSGLIHQFTPEKPKGTTVWYYGHP